MQPTVETRITDNDEGHHPRSFHRPERRTLFADLAGPNLRGLKRYVASNLRQSWDVDDIVQQTLMKAYLHLDQFRFEAKFGTWLRRIALNEIRQLMRERARQGIAEELDPNTPDGRESVFAVFEREEAACEVRRAVRGLTGEYQVAVTLHLDGLGHAEIAERMSTTPGAVKLRLYRARRQLAGRLSRNGGE